MIQPIFVQNISSLLVYLVHTPYLVPTTGIFTYGTASDPRSPSHEPSTESVTPKGNTTLRNKPPNLLPNVPAELYSEPSSSNYSSSDLSDSSYGEFYKRR